MRKLILSLLILLVFINASAQSTNLQELKEQLRNHPQQDTFRVNRLTEIAARRGALSAAGRDSAADEALLLSRQLNYIEGEVHALIAKGTRERPQAIDLRKKALTIAEKSGDKKLISEALVAVGTILYGTEQNELGLHYLLNGEAIAQSLKDKRQLASAQGALLEFYSFNGDFVNALDWGLKAIHTAEYSNAVEPLANILGNLSAVYTSLADTPQRTILPTH